MFRCFIHLDMTTCKLFYLGVGFLALVTTGCGSDESAEKAAVPRGDSQFAQLELDVGLSLTCGSCHASNVAQGGFGFTDLAPDEMRKALVNVLGRTAPDMPLVTPGDPEQSLLIRKLRGDFTGVECPGGCGVKMPIGNYPYAEGDRLDLEQWIKDGAL